jgi:hypothetical protein
MEVKAIPATNTNAGAMNFNMDILVRSFETLENVRPHGVPTL